MGRSKRARGSGDGGSRWLIFASMVALVGSLGSAVYTRLASGVFLRQAEELRTDISPSIERLVETRARLVELGAALFDLATAPPSANRSTDARIARVLEARRRIDEPLRAYRALPPLPGELPLQARLSDELDALDGHLRELEHGRAGVEASLFQSLERTDDALSQVIRFDVQYGSREVASIERTWRRSEAAELALAGLCIALAVAALSLALRAARRYTRSLEERSSELELFAGRVAHDVRSPLTAVGLSLEMLNPHEPTAAAGEGRERVLGRARSSLQRVHAIVEGLYEFARAGARPAGEAETDVGEVLEGVLGELQPQAAEAGVALEAGPFDACRVACSPGVLACLLSNLVRNALQHAGAHAPPRVAVRVEPRPERVCFEVEDTGPGVPRGWEQMIFEPYIRGPNASRHGIGLGLATVKRLVEAYAGTVGVRPGSLGGACFFIELPRASGHEAPAHPDASVA